MRKLQFHNSRYLSRAAVYIGHNNLCGALWKANAVTNRKDYFVSRRRRTVRRDRLSTAGARTNTIRGDNRQRKPPSNPRGTRVALYSASDDVISDAAGKQHNYNVSSICVRRDPLFQRPAVTTDTIYSTWHHDITASPANLSLLFPPQPRT